MATLHKYDIQGNEIGAVEFPVETLLGAANPQMVKDVIVALRANARQWSANTKTRAEVIATSRKPRPQKGTGNARQGCIAATQYRGGGRVFGPRPKFDQHVRINKRERQAVVRQLLGEKAEGARLHVLASEDLQSPQTRTMAQWLRARGLTGKRVLFLAEGLALRLNTDEGQVAFDLPGHPFPNMAASLRNIQRVEFGLFQNLNAYDLMVAHDVVITEDVLAALLAVLQEERETT
ncbi:MAG: 50S ribosomal protein L4 [Chlamydiia bacterium]